jgi:ribosome-associated protein
MRPRQCCPGTLAHRQLSWVPALSPQALPHWRDYLRHPSSLFGESPSTKGMTARMSATTSKAEGQKRSGSANRPSELRMSEPRKARPRAGSPAAAGADRDRQEEARAIATRIASAGLAKKAEDVQIIDVTGKVDYADFLVLMSGTSDRHVSAIAQNVESELALQGTRSLALEGLPLARWVLIDFVDVVVHVFQAEWRELYDLDGLWMDAARVALPAAPESA